MHIEGNPNAYYTPLPLKTVPNIVVGRGRGIRISNSFLYGASGPTIEVNAESAQAGVRLSLAITDTEFLGHGVDAAGTLIDLVDFQGGSVQIADCKFAVANTAYITVQAGFTGDFIHSGNAFDQVATPTPAARILDNRALPKPSSQDVVLSDRDIGVQGAHFMSSSANNTARPAAAAGAGAGVSPPATGFNALSTDTAGQIRFGSGTATSAGSPVVNVTFARAFASAPIVLITPANAATAALGAPYVGASTSAFAVYFPSALAVSQANTVYQFNYFVIGTQL